MPGQQLPCPSQNSQYVYQVYMLLAFLVDFVNYKAEKDLKGRRWRSYED